MIMLLIKNGLIHNAVDRNPFIADILVDNKKIARIEPDMFWDGAEVYDAAGSEMYSGFVEAYAHTSLSDYGIGYEGHGYNELGDIISPQPRAIDGIESRDGTLLEARNAGVITLCVGPGSANVLGSTSVAIKPVGCRVEQMYLKKEVAMRCAFDENPKRNYKEKGSSSRMTIAARPCDVLPRAGEYEAKLANAGDHTADRPPLDMRLQAMLLVLRKRIPLKVHARQVNDFFIALRIARGFDVDITLEHVMKRHLVAEELVKESIVLAVGPTLGYANKLELGSKTWDTPGVLAVRGCHVSIITDALFIPQQHLALCAGLAARAGTDESEALKAITIRSVEHIDVVHRVGSLEAGKDADIVVTDGNSFDVQTNIPSVFIDGGQVFSCRRQYCCDTVFPPGTDISAAHKKSRDSPQKG